MKNTVIKLLSRILFLAVPVPFLILYFHHHGYIPLITSNISIDAKLFEANKNDLKNIELISLGSSMTLTNLNSGILNKNIKASYYNFGAWGLQISDVNYFLKYYLAEYNPKYIIICSCISDFKNKDAFQLPLPGELALYNYSKYYFYLKNLSLYNLDKHTQEYLNYQRDSADYNYLNFDENGGVPLVIPKNKISNERWNAKFIFPTGFTEYQYSELNAVAKTLHDRSIRLIFIETPLKKSFVDGDSTAKKLMVHFARCKSIVENNNGLYLNFHNTLLYTDTLFVDQTHLSKTGSEIFTKQVTDKIKSLFGDAGPGTGSNPQSKRYPGL